jgi:energy-coupling factor transporter ATP-binding protein EcfA2
VGLSYRVGRHVPGAAAPFKVQLSDIARNMLQQPGATGACVAHHTSILLVGRPGVGKTTLLRDMARVLADEHRLAVVVVDSSLEIAGGRDICLLDLVLCLIGLSHPYLAVSCILFATCMCLVQDATKSPIPPLAARAAWRSHPLRPSTTCCCRRCRTMRLMWSLWTRSATPRWGMRGAECCMIVTPAGVQNHLSTSCNHHGVLYSHHECSLSSVRDILPVSALVMISTDAACIPR